MIINKYKLFYLIIDKIFNLFVKLLNKLKLMITDMKLNIIKLFVIKINKYNIKYNLKKYNLIY